MARNIQWKKIGKDVGVTGAVIGSGFLATKLLNGSSNSASSSSSDEEGATSGTATDGSTGESTDDASSTDGNSSSSNNGSDGSTSTKKKVVEVPITNYKEAMEFANREWNKIKRNNGRTLECQVLGSSYWRTGEWCKVYLPSFDIDGYMYITRVSQSSDGGDWTANLTLVDYPPGWGKEELTDDSESESESETDTETTDDTSNETTTT